jgi:deoxyribonuclease V
LEDQKPLDQIETIAGIDASYTENTAFGAIAILKMETFEVLESHTIRTSSRFPYIPTYLSYHELPVAKELLSKLSIKPDIIQFDGNGVLHPLGLGLASHAGVIFDIPTLGIAKKLLIGQISSNIESRQNIFKIHLKNELIGFAIKPQKTKKNLVYVSPGHKISFDYGLRIAEKICIHRTPEPVRIAHRLALGMRREFEKSK